MRSTTSIRAVSTVTTRLITLLALLVTGGCKNLDVPDYNNPSLEDLSNSPTPAGVQAAAAGLLLGARRSAGNFALTLGHFGREGYSLNVAQGGLPSYLIGPLDPGNFLTGQLLWREQYRSIRTANILLGALDQVAGMSAAEKEAVRGFAKTLSAYEFLMVIATRDTFGIPVDVDRDPSGDPAPIVDKASAYARILQLLDEAQTHLQAGGSEFPFALPSGFTGFDQPATFILFNRALRARVNIYLGNWAAALTDLNGSFLDTTAPLGMGVYHNFSTNSGDESNQMFSPAFLYADVRVRSAAQHRTDGSLDLRAQNKVTQVSSFSLGGVTTDLQYTIYDGPSASQVWIKNEELILLRAEANLGLGNDVAAVQDINVIRVNSGGLPAIVLPYAPGAGDPPTLLDELLYEKRYSLWWEWGHVWLDMRHYGKLAEIPKAQPNHKVYDVIPLPIDECLARTPTPRGCSAVVGI